MPFVGGEYFTFFNPVFNFADVAISTGVGLLLVYNHRNSSSKQNLN
jgi:signal peptidase II